MNHNYLRCASWILVQRPNDQLTIAQRAQFQNERLLREVSIPPLDGRPRGDSIGAFPPCTSATRWTFPFFSNEWNSFGERPTATGRLSIGR